KRDPIGERNDLIVIPMHHQRRNADRLEILGEISLRERLNAVVMRLGAAHHALAPPVVDHGLRHLRSGAVKSVERPAREISIDLRAIGGELLAETVEHLDRQTARISGCLQHDWRDRADQHELGYPALAMPCGIVCCFSAPGRMADVYGISQIEM